MSSWMRGTSFPHLNCLRSCLHFVLGSFPRSLQYSLHSTVFPVFERKMMMSVVLTLLLCSSFLAVFLGIRLVDKRNGRLTVLSGLAWKISLNLAREEGVFFLLCLWEQKTRTTRASVDNSGETTCSGQESLKETADKKISLTCNTNFITHFLWWESVTVHELPFQEKEQKVGFLQLIYYWYPIVIEPLNFSQMMTHNKSSH